MASRASLGVEAGRELCTCRAMVASGALGEEAGVCEGEGLREAPGALRVVEGVRVLEGEGKLVMDSLG
jgi:hypothetical protein